MSLEKARPAAVSGTWERRWVRAWAGGGPACAVAGRQYYNVPGKAVTSSRGFLFPATIQTSRWTGKQNYKKRQQQNEGRTCIRTKGRCQGFQDLEFFIKKPMYLESGSTFWHLLSDFDDWLPHWVSVRSHGGVWGRSNFPIGSVNSFSLMKCFLWFRDHNPLLGFMPNIGSVRILYGRPGEIQLIVFDRTERLSFLIFSSPAHAWLLILPPFFLSIV